MRKAVSSSVVASLLVGILVGAVLVFATPVVFGDLASTTTVTEPPTTVTATEITDITQIQPVGVTTTATATVTNLTTTTETLVENVTTTVTEVAGETTTQFGSYGVADVVQSCGAFGNPSQTASCSLADAATSGDLLELVVAEVPSSQTVTTTATTQGATTTTTGVSGNSSSPTVSDSLGDTFALIGMTTRPSTTYDFYVYVANVTSGGPDQVTLNGLGNYPFLLVHELKGVTHVVGFSSGEGVSRDPSVTPYALPSGAFVLASVFVLNDRGSMAGAVGAGSGYTTLDETFGVSEEYAAPLGTTASPFLMSSAIPWGELSVAFA